MKASYVSRHLLGRRREMYVFVVVFSVLFITTKQFTVSNFCSVLSSNFYSVPSPHTGDSNHTQQRFSNKVRYPNAFWAVTDDDRFSVCFQAQHRRKEYVFQHHIKFTFPYLGRSNSTSKTQGSELGYCNYISCAFCKFLGFPPPEHAIEKSELANDITAAFPRMASDMPQISNVPLLTMDPNNSTDDSENKMSYRDWSDRMKNDLSKQGLWDIIEGSSRTNPKSADWTAKNSAALKAIYISCEPSVRAQLWGISSAETAWKTLANMDQVGVHPTKQLATSASWGLNLGHLRNIAKPPLPSPSPSPSPSPFSQGLKLDMGQEGISELVRNLTANFNSNMPVSQEAERKLIILMLQAYKL